MSRYIYQGVAKDGMGKVLQSATVSVYLAGTTTAATVYAAASGGTSRASVTSGDDGHFVFWVDEDDYLSTQRFKIVVSKTSFVSKTYDNIRIPLIDITGAYIAYTPVITAGAGSFTTVSAAGWYTLVGEMVHLQLKIEITTNGTASDYINFTLPVVSHVSVAPVFHGREVALTGKAVVGSGWEDSGGAIVGFYDNTYAGDDGYEIWLSGSYRRK